MIVVGGMALPPQEEVAVPCVALALACEVVSVWLLSIDGVAGASIVVVLVARHVLGVLTAFHAQVQRDAALALPEGVHLQRPMVAC